MYDGCHLSTEKKEINAQIKLQFILENWDKHDQGVCGQGVRPKGGNTWKNSERNQPGKKSASEG
jgi:hypothetical protein